MVRFEETRLRSDSELAVPNRAQAISAFDFEALAA